MKKSFILLSAIGLMPLFMEACVDDLPKSSNKIPGWQAERQSEYMKFACDAPFNAGSVMGVLIHLECAYRGLIAPIPDGSVPENAWDSLFKKFYNLEDTSDFNVNHLINLLYAFEGDPAIDAGLWAKIEDALLNFKYWFADPTPDRTNDKGEKVVDMMWYWSENHVLLFRSAEFLAGQRYPEKVFAVTGMTGRKHMERARAEIMQWLDERGRFGFTEWHSDVYYNWDMQPLLTLIEWSRDEEMVLKATMVLDLIWLDVALNLHKGYFGATHGRSYIKDKPAAVKEDTFTATKLFFDDTTLPLEDANAGAAIAFSRAKKYVMPYVLRSIARDDAPMEDKEKMNLPIDESPPAAWDSPVAQPPYGFNYNDDKFLPMWWSMSAFVSWPCMPKTFEVGNKHNLWAAQFKDFSMIADIVDLNQPIEDIMESVYPYYKMFWKVFNQALLKEVRTYTYRTGDYMLSSAVDYRAGMMSAQIHSWQATLDETASVFTTHPSYLPVAEGQQPPAEWNWQKEDEPGPGYWTGQASLPRIAQYKNVAIIIYAPQFAPKPLGIKSFDYREETHAYFPQAHFDETAQEGSWTFGRKGDSYVALYSLKPTTWRLNQPDVYNNGDKPFDLVAGGGAENVWIAELGSKSENGSFNAFKSTILAAALTTNHIADAEGDGYDDGYDVEYVSPSQGKMTFGWSASFKVKDALVPLNWDSRFDNKYVKSDFNSGFYEIKNGEHKLWLDFSSGLRKTTAGPNKP